MTRHAERCPQCNRFVAADGECGHCHEQPTTTQLKTERTPSGDRIQEVHTARAMSDDELLEFFDVDEERWEVLTSNRWFNGSVWCHQLKTRPRKGLLDLEAIAEDTIRDMKRHAPDYRKPPTIRIKDDADRHMLELAIPDLHVGKLAWHEETGENYDVNIAVELFHWAVDNLMQKARTFPVDKIILPVGNDILHVDNLDDTTTAGTPQDVDGRWQQSFRRARQMIVTAVDELREKAPVRIVIVPGNHDRERSFYLGDSLESWYSREGRVSVDNSPNPRKYIHYGCTLLGFTHGNEEKTRDLPTIMATEVPQLWANAEFREFHCGHWHRKKETKFVPVDEFNGVRVRVIPSLSARDEWHHRRGFVKTRRSAEAYLYNRETGLAGFFSANVMPDAA